MAPTSHSFSLMKSSQAHLGQKGGLETNESYMGGEHVSALYNTWMGGVGHVNGQA